MITTEDAKIAMHKGTKMKFEGCDEYTIKGLIFRIGGEGYHASAELIREVGDSIVVPLAWLSPSESNVVTEAEKTEEDRVMMCEWMDEAERGCAEYLQIARTGKTKEAQEQLHELMKMLLKIDAEYIRILHQRIEEGEENHEQEEKECKTKSDREVPAFTLDYDRSF